MGQWTLALANQLVPSLVFLGFRQLFLLQDDLARGRDPSDAGDVTQATARSWTSAEAARLLAFLAALTVGGVWSFGSLAAIGYWFASGRGPGGRLLASGSGSAGAAAAGC